MDANELVDSDTFARTLVQRAVSIMANRGITLLESTLWIEEWMDVYSDMPLGEFLMDKLFPPKE
jgi:hypothetical protein